MARLAFYTFGMLRGPFGSAAARGFEERVAGTFAAARAAAGFIDLAAAGDGGTGFGLDYGAWGRFVAPRFYDGGTTPGTVTVAATLSLWQGIEAVGRYAYSGVHGAVLRHRGEWFREGDWPGYVMWWVGDGEVPRWAEAARRLERLHDSGPGPEGFSFRFPFTAEGAPRPRGPDRD